MVTLDGLYRKCFDAMRLNYKSCELKCGEYSWKSHINNGIKKIKALALADESRLTKGNSNVTICNSDVFSSELQVR